MSLKEKCSLKDVTELKKLILENPDLPLLAFTRDDVCDDEYSYVQADARVGGVENLTLYDNMWLDEDDYTEKLSDDLCDEEEYANLSDAEFFEMIEQRVKETEFVKAIVIWIG